MAATRSRCSVVFGCFYAYLLLFLIHGPIQSKPKSLLLQHISKILMGIELSTEDTGWIFILKLGGWFKLDLTVHGYYKSRFAASKWSKHGLTCLHIPGHDPPVDMTVSMDVSPNPGPDIPTNRICSSRSCVDLHMSSCQDSMITYSRNRLFKTRRTSICPRVLPKSIYTELKNSGYITIEETEQVGSLITEISKWLHLINVSLIFKQSFRTICHDYGHIVEL